MSAIHVAHGMHEVDVEARLARWREVTASDVAAAQRALLDRTRRESLWPTVGRGVRFAPMLPITLAAGPAASVVNNTFTGPQSLTSVAAAIGAMVGPHSTDYFKNVGCVWEQEAMGLISTTVTPTISIGTYFGVVVATITTVLALSPVITTASGLANVDWYYKVMGRTVASAGAASTMIVTGLLWGNIEVLGATAATEPTQPVKNATPPTAVTVDLSTSVCLDLKATFGTSSVSNQITLNYYKLASLYVT